jgi:hypothetical protein
MWLGVDTGGSIDFDTVCADDKRHLIEHMDRAPIFDDTYLTHGHAVEEALDASQSGALEPGLDAVNSRRSAAGSASRLRSTSSASKTTSFAPIFRGFCFEPCKQRREVKRAGLDHVSGELRVQK